MLFAAVRARLGSRQENLVRALAHPDFALGHFSFWNRHITFSLLKRIHFIMGMTDANNCNHVCGLASFTR